MGNPAPCKAWDIDIDDASGVAFVCYTDAEDKDISTWSTQIFDMAVKEVNGEQHLYRNKTDLGVRRDLLQQHVVCKLKLALAGGGCPDLIVQSAVFTHEDFDM